LGQVGKGRGICSYPFEVIGAQLVARVGKGADQVIAPLLEEGPIIRILQHYVVICK
jgi:hypothetical protein